jgi:hypothetical protein
MSWRDEIILEEVGNGVIAVLQWLEHGRIESV